MSAARHLHDSLAECNRLKLDLENLLDFVRAGHHITFEEIQQCHARCLRVYTAAGLAEGDLKGIPSQERRVFHVEHGISPLG